jgi:hypothetical protein
LSQVANSVPKHGTVQSAEGTLPKEFPDLGTNGNLLGHWNSQSRERDSCPGIRNMSGSGWASDAHATWEPVTRPVKKKKEHLRVVQSTEQECQSEGSFLDSEHKFGLRWCTAFMVQQCLHTGFQRTEVEENGNRYCAQTEGSSGQ